MRANSKPGKRHNKQRLRGFVRRVCCIGRYPWSNMALAKRPFGTLYSYSQAACCSQNTVNRRLQVVNRAYRTVEMESVPTRDVFTLG